MTNGDDSTTTYEREPDSGLVLRGRGDATAINGPPLPPSTGATPPTFPQQGPPSPPSQAASFPGAVPKPSTGRRVAGAVGGFLAGFGRSGPEFMQTPLGKSILDYQKSRMDETSFRAQNMHVIEGKLALAQRGIDPDTGQPLTSDQQQAKISEYTNQYNAEEAQFEKLAGVTPQIKKHLQQAKQVKNALRQKIAQAAGQKQQQQQGAPPPPAQAQPSAQAPPTQQGGPPAPPSTPSTALAPPPDPNSLAGQAISSDAATTRTISERSRLAKIAGLQPGTPDYQEYMATGKFPTTHAMQGSNYIDETTGEVFGGTFDPDTGQIRDNTGAVRSNARKATATDIAPKLEIYSVNGKPSGVKRNGIQIPPGGPGWDKQMQDLYDEALKTWQEGEKQKDDRVKLSNEYRQSYFGSLPQAVLFKQDVPGKGKAGDLGFVSRQEAAAHPELYAPPAQGVTAMGTGARFDEIQATVDLTNDALDHMPKEAWDATSRAQIAAVMRSPNPESALHEFLTSTAATSLSEDQVRYVTALASMQESASSMASLAGMGRATDSLRGAIKSMLPGATTPSKDYAKRQMQLFQVELDRLRRGVPGVGSAGTGGGPPAPPSSGEDNIGFIPIK